MKSKNIVLVLILIIGAILVGLYAIGGPPEEEELIFLDPNSDLLIEDDLPEGFVEDPELSWEDSGRDLEWGGVPVDNISLRWWENDYKVISYFGFVCPSIEDAENMVDEAHNYWLEDMKEDFDYVEEVDFPSYGNESKVSKGVIESPEEEMYLVTIRVKNVTVTLITINLSESETRDYARTVEGRIMEGSGFEVYELEEGDYVEYHVTASLTLEGEEISVEDEPLTVEFLEITEDEFTVSMERTEELDQIIREPEEVTYSWDRQALYRNVLELSDYEGQKILDTEIGKLEISHYYYEEEGPLGTETFTLYWDKGTDLFVELHNENPMGEMTWKIQSTNIEHLLQKAE